MPGWGSRGGQSGGWRPTGKRCQFSDISMPAVACMLRTGEDWVREGGIDVTNQEEVFTWLGRKVIWGSIEVSRLVQMFYRFGKGQELRQEGGVE